MKKIYLILSFVLLSGVVFSAEVDTVEVFSKAMNKNIKTVTILPESYEEEADFPVLYLLHGYGGNYADWVNRAPELKAFADR